MLENFSGFGDSDLEDRLCPRYFRMLTFYIGSIANLVGSLTKK